MIIIFIFIIPHLAKNCKSPADSEYPTDISGKYINIFSVRGGRQEANLF